MEKAKSDVEKLFSGFSKTRENLSVVDEILTYWNLSDTDRVLDELEEVALSARLLRDGKLKSGSEIKVNSVSNALILVDIVIAFVIYFVGCGE